MSVSNLKIGARLGLGFLLVLSLMLATFGVARVLSARSQHEMTAQYDSSTRRFTLLDSARAALYESGLAIRNIGLSSDTGEMQKHHAQANAMRQTFVKLLAELNTADQSPEEQQAIKELLQLDREMDKPITQASGLALAFDSEKAAHIITGPLQALHRRSLERLSWLVAHEEADAKAQAGALAVATQRLDLMLACMCAAALALAAGIAWFVTRGITAPLRQAVALADAVAQGDLSCSASYSGRDEVGQLMQSMNAMTARLTMVIGDIRSATGSIDVAAQEINTGNSDLSQRTEETASNLQQTAASLEQLTGTVQNTAATARSATVLAAETSASASQGGNVIAQVVLTMGEIDTASHRIADIISVIDGIAFQTNILALNAAVEAARAGEQGRGFAVVASEVRNLAQRSAQAAREIKSLIGASVEKVESGSRLVQDAGTAMTRIVGGVQRLNTLIGEITHSATEQSSGIGQVNTAVGQVDQMTQQNAALVEQSAAATEQLKDQAQRLSSMVETFRLAPAR
jgi:methyl-accepting chemotaxis protein